MATTSRTTNSDGTVTETTTYNTGATKEVTWDPAPLGSIEQIIGADKIVNVTRSDPPKR